MHVILHAGFTKVVPVDKGTEIVKIDRFIKELGDQSYLGPWLKQHRDEIAHAIAWDLPVETCLLDRIQRGLSGGVR